MTDYTIQIRELTRRYGDTVAVDHLTLDVARGEVFGFLGHNGAGKTTMVNRLTTRILPTSGTALVGGTCTSTQTARAVASAPTRIAASTRATIS